MSERLVYVLSDMSWPEAKQALETVRVALIAVGSSEQHGPNLAMQADTAQAYAFATKLAERFYPQVLLAPPLHVGLSDHHMNFPGSLRFALRHFMLFCTMLSRALAVMDSKSFFWSMATAATPPR
jgi:creatinine amidohydrolase